MDQSGQSGHVSGVEDDNHVLNVRAVLLDVVTEVSSDLAVALQQILTCHASLTRSTTRGDDVFSAGESLLGSLGNLLGIAHVLNGRSIVGDVGTGECALLNLIEDTMNTRLIDIVETYVRSKAEHQNALHHVGTDHTACTDDDQLVIC